jgi:O-antigen ligase
MISKVNYRLNDMLIFNFFMSMWILSIPFKNAIFQGSVFFMILFFFYHLFKTKKVDILIENLKETKYLALGFLFIALSMLVSNLLNPEYLREKSWHITFMFIIRYGLIFVILAYFYKLNFFSKKQLIITISCSFILLLLTGLFQVIESPQILLGEGIKGTLDYRNAFGLSMGMAFVFSLYLLNYQRNLALILILLFVFFMIFSFSRSSWVASFSSMIVFLILHKKELKFNHLIYFLLFIVFIILLYFSFDSFQKRFHDLIDGDSSYRFQIWSYTLDFIKEKLIFGYGIDSWLSLPNTFLNGHADAHNMILEILIYTGIFGLISCLFTIGTVLIKIILTKNYFLFTAATYFIVVTQFDFGAYGSKELLSFLTIFVFFVYSESFKAVK